MDTSPLEGTGQTRVLAAIGIGIDPIAFSIAGREVRWYGIFIAVAIMVVMGVAVYRAKRAGVPDDVIYKAAVWAIPGGFIVSRLLHVIDQIDYYAAHPGAILGFEGLTIYGAIVGATLAVVIYAAITKEAQIGRLLHVAAPGVILGQAVGRLGCIVNGCCYGSTTQLPWAFIYSHPNAYAPLGVATHPAVVYELFWDLAVFALLLVLQSRVKPNGTLYAIYLALYATGRFLIDFTRAGTPFVFGLHQAQVVSLVVLAVAGFVSVYRSRRTAAQLPIQVTDRPIEG